jgi:hypothetical protein
MLGRGCLGHLQTVANHVRAHRNASFPSSLQLARRLLKRETNPSDDDSARSARLQKTYAQVAQSLGGALGTAGCTALFARALSRADPHHPALRDMRLIQGGIIVPHGVRASVALHGIDVVTAATEALLAALLEVLTRVVGEDMALQLVDADAQDSVARGGAALL